MSKQRERSRQASQFTADYTVAQQTETPTEFTGHKNLLIEGNVDTGKVLALYRDGKFVDILNSGEKGSVVLDRTPFYAEAGGQVGDQGRLYTGSRGSFETRATHAPQGERI